MTALTGDFTTENNTKRTTTSEKNCVGKQKKHKVTQAHNIMVLIYGM